jgi:hypothetical protein
MAGALVLFPVVNRDIKPLSCSPVGRAIHQYGQDECRAAGGNPGEARSQVCPCPRVTVRVAFLALAKRRRRARRTTGIAAEGQLAARMCPHLEGGDRCQDGARGAKFDC